MSEQKSDGNWKKYIWNPEKKEFFGRTAGSWLKILGFYLIFYAFLTGVFFGTIFVLLKTLDTYKPKHQDLILPAGLSFEPYANNFDIIFNQNDPSSYEKYVKSLEEFIKKYNDERQTDDMKYEDCGIAPKTYTYRGELESKAGQRKSCRFSRKVLRDCSGEIDATFGFGNGTPCLILKINRVINFRPKPPPTTDMLPGELKSKSYYETVIPVLCRNRWTEDDGNVGEIKYFGFADIGGFPLQYYPYYGKRLQPNYLQPLVGVKFLNLTRNKEMRLQCRMYGDSYDVNSHDGLFDVHITVQQ